MEKNISKDRIDLFNRLFTIKNNWHDVLYVHTPFCVQKCYYCVYSSKEPDGPDRNTQKSIGRESLSWPPRSPFVLGTKSQSHGISSKARRP